MTFERLAPWLMIIVTITALSMALSAEHVFKLEPCILCLYQRLPYVATGLLALLALKLPTGSTSIPLIVGLCGLVYLTGAGIAVYHVGVEQHWWISSCTGVTAGDISFDQMKASLLKKAEKSCDDLNWTLFGFSMASYNAVFSLAIGAMSLLAARLIWKNHEPKKNTP